MRPLLPLPFSTTVKDHMRFHFKAKWLRKFIPGIPIVIICLLVMLPRIQSPQFGLLDDGFSIKVVQELSQDPFSAFSFFSYTGRFLPGYWLFQTALFQFLGASARKWAIIYYLILTLESIGVFFILRLRGFSRSIASAAGILFCLSGPVIESFYTFSKAEILVIGWIIFALITFGLSTRVKTRWKQAALLFLTTTGLLFSMLSKEVGITTIGIFAGWAIVSKIFPDSSFDFLDRRRSLLLFFLSLGAGILYITLFFYFVPFFIGGESFTSSNYEMDYLKIQRHIFDWISFFLRDFLYLIPLLFLFVMPSFRKPGVLRGFIEQVIWMGAWVLIYLPWPNLQEYFIFPFGLGCSILGGILLGRAFELLFSPSNSIQLKIFSGFPVLLSVFLLQLNLANNITNARIQLLYDNLNFAMVRYVSHLPENAFVTVNFPETLEYYPELGLHLSLLRNRQDIQIEPFRFQGIHEGDPKDYYIVTPIFQNQTLPSVRNSINEHGVRLWDSSLNNFLNGNGKQIYSKADRINLLDFGTHRILLPLGVPVLHGSLDRPLIDGRFMSYGWTIYHIQIQEESQYKPGFYRSEGIWQLKNNAGDSVEITSEVRRGIPLAGDVNGDGWSDPGVFRVEEQVFSFDTDLDEKIDFRLSISGMLPEDIPFMSDWDGDGFDTPGYFRPRTHQWFFFNQNEYHLQNKKTIVFGAANCQPIVGDWQGDGRDEFGTYCPQTGTVSLALDFLPEVRNRIEFSVEAGKHPVPGDWYGFGFDTLALVGDNQWCFHPYNSSSEPSNLAKCMNWETGEGIPLSGRWRLK